MAPVRHRENLGRISTGFVGSGCARRRIVGLGLIGSDRRISRELEGTQDIIVRLREDFLVVWSAAAPGRPEPTRIGVFRWRTYTTSTANDT